MYLEGQPVTNSGAIAYKPSNSDCAESGIFIGSEGTNGIFQARGQFQNLWTYASQLSAEEIAWDYEASATDILSWGGSLPSSGFSPDVSPPSPGTGGMGGGGGGVPGPYLPNPGTNLWLFIAQVSNTVVVTLSNTVVGSNYVLLVANSLSGPWFTNQSILATNSNHTAVALPVPIPEDTNVFFVGEQAPPPVLGTLKWKVFIGGDGDAHGPGIDGSPAIGPDGTIYIRGSCNGYSTSNLLYAIDYLTGNVKWTNNIFTNDSASDDSRSTGTEFSSSPAIGTNGTIYVGNDDGRLYAVGNQRDNELGA